MKSQVKSGHNRFLNLLVGLPRYFLLITMLLVFIGFAVAAPPFLSFTNFLDIFREASIIGLMGLGLTVAVVAGEFDFSIGATATISAVVAGKVLSLGVINSATIAFFIGILAALMVGLINSFNVLKVHMPSFIATLGVATLLDGISKYLTGGAVFYSVSWPATFGLLGKGYVFKVVPVPSFIFIIVGIISWIFLHRTTIGRYEYAVGNNPDAATHLGLKRNKIKFIAFVLSAVLSGFAGIIQGSMLGSVSPLMGSGNLLPAITTVMLGATFLIRGIPAGNPNMLGTFLAALLVAIIRNGLTMIGASYYMKDIVTGVILVIAVGIIAIYRKGKLGQMITGL